jgi:4-hydroxy-3-methylbut-2-enyl diphosphate reductase
MVDRAEQLQAAWVAGARHVGITAGASAPEVLVKEVMERLRALGAASVTELAGTAENVVFPLPKGLAPGAARGVRTG